MISLVSYKPIDELLKATLSNEKEEENIPGFVSEWKVLDLVKLIPPTPKLTAA